MIPKRIIQIYKYNRLPLLFHISQNIDYYCFSFLDFINLKEAEKKEIIKNSSLLSQFHSIKYNKIPELCRKHKIKKNLIKPLYLS